MASVTVYGTAWSVTSWDVRRLLDGIDIPYRFVDLETDDAAMAWVVRECDAPNVAACLPLVKFADGRVMQAATRKKVADVYGVRLDTGVLMTVTHEQDASLTLE